MKTYFTPNAFLPCISDVSFQISLFSITLISSFIGSLHFWSWATSSKFIISQLTKKENKTKSFWFSVTSYNLSKILNFVSYGVKDDEDDVDTEEVVDSGEGSGSRTCVGISSTISISSLTNMIELLQNFFNAPIPWFLLIDCTSLLIINFLLHRSYNL